MLSGSKRNARELLRIDVHRCNATHYSIFFQRLDHVERGASPAQGPQQSSGKFACSPSKARTSDARLPIMERTSKIRRKLLRRPQPLRSTAFTPPAILPPICIACRRWQSGNPSRLPLPEMVAARSLRLASVNLTSPFQRLSGTTISRCAEESLALPRDGNRQAFRCGKRL